MPTAGDISKITLLSGNTYALKDETARESIADLSGGKTRILISSVTVNDQVMYTLTDSNGTQLTYQQIYDAYYSSKGVVFLTGSNVYTAADFASGCVRLFMYFGSDLSEFIFYQNGDYLYSSSPYYGRVLFRDDQRGILLVVELNGTYYITMFDDPTTPLDANTVREAYMSLYSVLFALPLDDSGAKFCVLQAMASDMNRGYICLEGIVYDSMTYAPVRRMAINFATGQDGILSASSSDVRFYPLSSETASSGGTDLSFVTTGEKYTWNNKGTYSKPSGGIPDSDISSAATWNAKSDFSGAYDDLTGKPNVIMLDGFGVFGAPALTKRVSGGTKILNPLCIKRGAVQVGYAIDSVAQKLKLYCVFSCQQSEGVIFERWMLYKQNPTGDPYEFTFENAPSKLQASTVTTYDLYKYGSAFSLNRDPKIVDVRLCMIIKDEGGTEIDRIYSAQYRYTASLSNGTVTRAKVQTVNTSAKDVVDIGLMASSTNRETYNYSETADVTLLPLASSLLESGYEFFVPDEFFQDVPIGLQIVAVMGDGTYYAGPTFQMAEEDEGGSVRYDISQSLTSTQQETARSNIGVFRITAENVSVAASAWELESTPTYASFPYRAGITVSGVTSDMFPEVIFSPDNAMSGNYAPVANTSANTVYIYAKSEGAVAITIPSILAH